MNDRSGLGIEHQTLAYLCLAALPGCAAALLLVWLGDYSMRLRLTVAVCVIVPWVVAAAAIHRKIVRVFQTLANTLGALLEGDFSIRVRFTGRRGVLGDVVREVNALGDILREQRAGSVEAQALLRTVMTEIDIAIFAFDDSQRLRLANRAGERLLSGTPEKLLGRTADELGLAEALSGESQRTLEARFPGGSGRWGLRRSSFREGGRPHHLLVMADLSRALRDEERAAWQRLLRVLGHELNNSLAPIRSLSGSLQRIVRLDPLPDDWREDVERGLSIIASRAEGLHRFMDGYSRLARLPQPRMAAIDVGDWVRSTVKVETRRPIALREGPEASIQGDRDQLEQLLINLVRNAVDAVEEAGGQVAVGWNRDGARVEVFVEDEGPGIANPSNLFVPFFTTKPNGSGIGLALSRQIAEAHGGDLSLRNREGARGSIAVLRLPA